MSDHNILEDHIIQFFFGSAEAPFPQVPHIDNILVTDVFGHLESVSRQVERDLSDVVDGSETSPRILSHLDGLGVFLEVDSQHLHV